MRIKCNIGLQSDMPLNKVGERLSALLFGNVPFGGLEDYIYEEVPAIYIQADIIGCTVVLQGYGGDDGFALDISSIESLGIGGDAQVIDISSYIAEIIESNKEITVTAVGMDTTPLGLPALQM